MFLKNPRTLSVIHPSELSYFVKLGLASSFISEDWIAEQLAEQEVDNQFMTQVNAYAQELLSAKVHQNKRYEIKRCFIHEPIEHTVNLVDEGTLIVEVIYYLEMKTQWSFHKKKHAKIMKTKDVFGTLEVQLTVNAKVVTDLKLKSITLLSEGVRSRDN